jgi:hypothetical protein
MDELAQYCYVAYAVAANVVRCWQLYVGRALEAASKDFKFWCREEQERPWQTDIKQIFRPNPTEEFSVCTSGTIGSFCRCRQIPTQKRCRDQNCVAATGALGENVPTFGCRGDMLPTCRQLSQPRAERNPCSLPSMPVSSQVRRYGQQFRGGRSES